MTNDAELADAERIREEAVAWVVRLADTPTPEAQADFRRWLDADPRHRQAHARVAHRFETAGVLRQSRRFSPRKRRRALPYIATAGVLAVAASLAITVLPGNVGQSARDRAEPTERGGPKTGTEILATVTGRIRSLTLPDGSRLTLDTNSRVRVAFSSAARHVTLLRGRARFAIARDKRPFTVFAGEGSITDKGTVFDVALEDSGAVHVQLLQGAIDIAEHAARHGKGATVHHLTAGTQIAYGAAAPPARPQPFAPGRSTWPEGIVDADGVALGSLVASANRYTDRPIVLADPALAGLRVSGRFGVRDSDRLATNLAELLDLRVDRRANAIVLAPS
jgi:transmembrane sensor